MCKVLSLHTCFHQVRKDTTACWPCNRSILQWAVRQFAELDIQLNLFASPEKTCRTTEMPHIHIFAKQTTFPQRPPALLTPTVYTNGSLNSVLPETWVTWQPMTLLKSFRQRLPLARSQAIMLRRSSGCGHVLIATWGTGRKGETTRGSPASTGRSAH